MVTEFEFIGLATQGQTQNLMAEADTKDWFPADQLADVVFGIRHRVRIARSIG